MKTSNLYSLNYKDLLIGLLLAVVSAILEALFETLSKGELTIDFNHMGSVALCAGIGYLKIKFFTPAQQVTPIKKPEEAAKL